MARWVYGAVGAIVLAVATAWAVHLFGPSSGGGETAEAARSSATVADFRGVWVNRNPKPGVTRAVIDQRLDQLRIHLWGKCHPTDCDQGVAFAEVADAFDGVVKFTKDSGFKVSTHVLTLQPDGSLLEERHTRFTDGSGRPAYESSDYLHRE